MALFGSARDASLIRSVNKELVDRYVDTEVSFYKLSLEDTAVNLYGESDNKVYYSRMRMNCLILKDDKSPNADEYGLDYTRTATFSFLRDSLAERNIIVEEGDIVQYDNEYFEIDSVSSTQYWSGRNPGTDIGYTTGDRGEFGYSVSIICQAHVTRRNRLNIEEVRSGINVINDLYKDL